MLVSRKSLAFVQIMLFLYHTIKIHRHFSILGNSIVFLVFQIKAIAETAYQEYLKNAKGYVYNEPSFPEEIAIEFYI